MNRIRKSAAIGAVVAAAALAVVGTPAAQAGPAPWCTSSDLVIKAYDVHPKGTEIKRHAIVFTTAEDVTCTIGGTLGNVRFLDAKGADMNVPSANGQGEYREVTVRGTFGPVAYVSSLTKGPQVTPAFVEFDLPGQKGSRGDRVTTAWPSWLGVKVSIQNIGLPVS